jgi:superfamily II DNA or RNA helicase
VCVVAPTGAGKTTIAAAALQGARSPLALVHTRTLRDQARRRLGPHVRVLTIQGALRRGVSLASHDVIFVDECHHLGSRSWVRVLGLLAPTALVLGCTATPQRADGTALGVGGAGFDALVATASYSELLRAGHLAPCRVVSAERFRGDPAGAYLARGGGRPGIVFTPTTAAARVCVTALTGAGVRAAAITAATSDRIRQQAFAAYDRGELDVLVSPMALSEGFDSPRAAVCVLDRSCDHVGTYLQTAGRVLRPHPTKGPGGDGPALVLDLRGAAARHGSPTDDRTYSLEGAGIASVAPAPGARRRPGAPAVASARQTTAARPCRGERRRADGVTAGELAHEAGAVVGGALAGVGRALAGWVRRTLAA